MGLDLSKYDNKFKVELGDDGKCKECGQFHSLNIAAKLISDCNGNFDPALHEEYVNAGVVKPKENNSAVLGEQTIDPIVLSKEQLGMPFDFEEGKKYKSRLTGLIGIYTVIDNKAIQNTPVIINNENKQAQLANDSKMWELVLPKQLLCRLDGNALHIFGDDFENLQESDSMFIPLTKKELKEFRKLREKLS